MVPTALSDFFTFRAFLAFLAILPFRPFLPLPSIIRGPCPRL